MLSQRGAQLLTARHRPCKRVSKEDNKEPCQGIGVNSQRCPTIPSGRRILVVPHNCFNSVCPLTSSHMGADAVCNRIWLQLGSNCCCLGFRWKGSAERCLSRAHTCVQLGTGPARGSTRRKKIRSLAKGVKLNSQECYTIVLERCIL